MILLKSNLPWSVVFSIAALCSVFPGCNGDGVVRGKVSGKLTMDGQPLTPAAIVFDNEAKAISLSAEVDANGIYQVKTHDAVGLPPGEYLVAVRPPMGGTQSIEALKKMADTSKIPQKYRSFKTSGLKRTVVEGTNTYDIDLQQAP